MSEGIRLDIWLDIACLAKTRSQAKDLCESGKVMVNATRAKAHRMVRPGDRVEITTLPGFRRQLVITKLAQTHISKAEARELYEDVTPPPTDEELEMRQIRRLAAPPAPSRGAGRPEKRDRRKMERMRSR